VIKDNLGRLPFAVQRALKEVETEKERKRAETELELENNALIKLNQFAVELSNLPSGDNLESLIVKQVKAMTCAEVVVFSDYNSENRTTTTKHIEIESGLLEKVVNLLGKQIYDIHSVVSDEDYRVITAEMIGIRKTLYEASFGAIPRSVGATIQALLKVDRIIGLAYIIEGKLYGTSLLLMGKGQPDPPKEILENFIHLAAVSLRRKKAEQDLVESEEKFKAIFQNSNDAFMLLDRNVFFDCNLQTLKLFKIKSKEEFLKLSPAELSPPVQSDGRNTVEEVEENISIAYSEGYNRFDWIHCRPNGEVFYADVLLSAFDYGGERVLQATVRDITERKYTELELIKAKEKAEESDRLKSAFLTNMSHEIRTPMNGILGFTELLKEPHLTVEEQQDFIQTIQISGARMLNTINSIVDISKIESGLIGVDIKETNLNEKIEFIYKFFKQEVGKKGLQFFFKYGLTAEEANINTDNEKVYGILTNLVRNAIKFTYEGSIEFGYEKKGKYLEFFVKDTGVGIPQNQHELIFERFRQGSENHNRGYEGSGLGLSISKSYVEMLGGRIWVESEEGKGSTFYFTIPYIALSEEETTIEKVVSSEHTEVQIKKLKILIVEDDEISYSLLTRTLQKIGKEVLHSITGVEAIEACRSNPNLDLILMDIRMPIMDGCEATRQIRQFNKDVIIIAQTAYAFAGDNEKAIEAGCNDYITKPINSTLLFELIKKHVIK
jgi:PAS domain S-box-containing protein